MPTEHPDLNHRDDPNDPNDPNAPNVGELETPPELRSLDARLSQDGAHWRATLPSTDRLARRLATALKAQNATANSHAPDADFSVPRVSRLSGRPQPPSSSSGELFMRQQRPMGRIFAGGAIVVLVALFAVVLALFHGIPGFNSPAGSPSTHPTVIPTQSTGNTGAFKVTSADLTVSPASIAGKSCGSSITFTYTVTFHLPQGNKGGTIQFMYTLDNGRSSTPAHVNVAPGQTMQQYTITSSGTLTPDHTYPGVAEVIVNSPNTVNSPQVKPMGACH